MLESPSYAQAYAQWGADMPGVYAVAWAAEHGFTLAQLRDETGAALVNVNGRYKTLELWDALGY
jgi:hypothetical protein